MVPVKKDREDQAIGRSRGGMATKIHAAVDALGNPFTQDMWVGWITIDDEDIGENFNVVVGDSWGGTMSFRAEYSGSGNRWYIKPNAAIWEQGLMA